MTSPGERGVAEACLELLHTELVALYQRQTSLRGDLAGRRIEAVGFQVGQQLAERYTKDRPRFTDHLDVIKFICKDFWSEVFRKQVDFLKTNHRGVFVLQDTKFRWLTRISADVIASQEEMDVMGTVSKSLNTNGGTGTVKAVVAASQYLYFPCGIIRGALTNLGVSCSVLAEVATLPSCSFTVRIKQ